MSVQYHQLMEDGCTFCYNQWQNGYCLRFETFLNQSRNCTVKPSFSPSFSISDILRQCISWLFFYKKRNKFSQVSLWHTHTYNIYLTYVTLTLWFEMAIEHSLSRDYKKLHHSASRFNHRMSTKEQPIKYQCSYFWTVKHVKIQHQT